jgi:hypothetical protein
MQTSRPVILDLFCGLGGASVGYHRAGFDVVGVDLAEQPDYPFKFRQRNALDVLSEYMIGWGRYDAIHASPPCQRDAAITRGTNKHLREQYPDLYPAVRRLLDLAGLPYVIENPAARPDVVLCGEMFGLGVIRHRNFELGGWTMPQPAHLKHRGRVRGWRHGAFYDGPYVAVYGNGGGKATVPEIREAMGIDWSVDRDQLVEAIPPAYTEFIGRALLRETSSVSEEAA